jgi:hypothetical protein
MVNPVVKKKKNKIMRKDGQYGISHPPACKRQIREYHSTPPVGDDHF